MDQSVRMRLPVELNLCKPTGIVGQIRELCI